MRASAIIVVLTAVLAATAAEAARAPRAAEQRAITTAARKASPKAPRSCFPLRIRVSTVDPRYASAAYRSVRTCSRVVGNGIFLLRRRSTATWSVVGYGSAFGCTAPLRPAVMRDLVSSCRKR